MFQAIIVAQFIAKQNLDAIKSAYDGFVNHFGNKAIQENIKNSKEEQYQEGFLKDLFVNVLGYTLNPQPNYNLTTEFKNLKGSKKCDGAILKDGHAIAVIELKGTDTTDLSKIESQAFGYKNNQPHCRYVITANFQKLRFYVDNAVEYLEFDLFKLSFEKFQELYLLLHADNLLNDVPLKLKNASISQEEKITKALYQDYSSFKRELFDDLTNQNPDFDQLVLFNKTQKLLDRLLFIFFCEDGGLLPANTAPNMIKEWENAKNLNIAISVYGHLKTYFNYLNTGYKGNGIEIFAYNGGLFKPDEILDNLIISDDVLYKNIKKLSDYDFKSEIDVNILGHIFENSLNEIDEIKAKINGDPLEKSQTKRKKDGVFYTPKYITNYIVQNTVGRLCADKKQEFSVIDKEYYPNRQTKTKNTLYANLQNYRNWLLQITICDPACGSGAFLNEALNFLIAEHHYIDELESKLENTPLIYQNIANHILENNLFGVDINEESVQIAKLSLWLRTAEPHRKLSNLSGNIKCGNSLIDDKSVAGDKAFDWQKEFPQVFEKGGFNNAGGGENNGGFDIVIGNPPYGAKIDKSQLDYLCQKFKKQGLNKVFSDTYVSFYILGLERILKKNGLLGYITPNTWRMVKNGYDFRNYLLKNFNIKYIVQHAEKVFSDATVDVDTVIIKNNFNDKNMIVAIIGDLRFSFNGHKIEQKYLLSEDIINLSLSDKDYLLKDKIELNSLKLSEICVVKNGVKPYEKGKGKPAQTAEVLKNKPFTSECKIDDSFSPLIGGSNFHRYLLLWNNDNWIKYGEWLASPRDKSIFDASEKLIFRQTSDRIIGCLIKNGFIMRNNTHIVLQNNTEYSLKYVLSVANSRLLNFYYTMINPEQGEALAEVKAFHLEKLPIKDIPLSEQQPFIEKANLMLELNAQFQAFNDKFLRTLNREFGLSEFSKNLQNWYLLSFKDFIKELEKKKIKLTLAQKSEWEDFFITEQQKATNLQYQINETDGLIDKMVYELYGLNDDEIAMIER